MALRTCIIASLHGPHAIANPRSFSAIYVHRPCTSHWSVKLGGPVNRPGLGPGTVLIRLWVQVKTATALTIHADDAWR